MTSMQLFSFMRRVARRALGCCLGQQIKKTSIAASEVPSIFYFLVFGSRTDADAFPMVAMHRLTEDGHADTCL